MLVLTVVALLLGFWISGTRGPDSGAPAGEDEIIAGFEAAGGERIPIFVHVVGEVRRPGVYRLPAEARVRDAIIAAGGFTPNAREESVNLAAFCEDGQQISVQARDPAPEPAVTTTAPVAQAPTEPSPESAPQQHTGPTATGHRPAADVAAAGTAGSEHSDLPVFAQQKPRPQVRINHAGLDELQEIPGIGPQTAQRIIYHRHLHGPFRSFSELEQVSGIGPQTVDRIRQSATLN